MHPPLKLAAFSAAMIAAVASFGAQAQSVDVKVTGQIVPAACAVNIGGNGVFDYGNIPASSITTGHLALETKTAPYSITCDASAKIGLRALDNRTFLTGLGSTKFYFSLGNISGFDVGVYYMSITNTTTDVPDAQTIVSTDNHINWSIYPGYGSIDRLSTTSWGSSTGPVAVTTVSGTIEVGGMLNKRDNLPPLTGVVPLDGHATLELVYL